MRHLSRRRALAIVAALPVTLACGAADTPVPTVPATKPATPTVATAPTSTRVPVLQATPTTAPVPPTATRPPAPTSTVAPSPDLLMTTPDFCIHVFLWGGFETTRRDVAMVREMGFRWVKQRFEWRYIEPHEKGKFEWNEPDRIVAAISSAGLKVIARIDNQPRWARSDPTWPIDGPPDRMGDFGDFLRALATRYRGKIQAYQIWNEPNLAREWGNKPPDPRQYVEMLKVAHAAVKAADPGAIVISGGLSPTTASGAIAMPDVGFVKQMYAAGGRAYFDMLGVHAAGFKAPPEASPAEIAQNPAFNHGEGAAGRIYGFRHAEDLRAVMVENGDANKRVAVLEFGWTSDDRPNSLYRWHAVTEQEKAAYLVRAYDWAYANWRPWIGLMSVIYIADPAWTRDHEQFHWAVTGPDGSKRAAYDSLAKMVKRSEPAPLRLAGAAGSP